jgi:feruloyl esterase
LEITKAEFVPAAPLPKSPLGERYKGIIPAYCRVDGVLESRIGANNISYGLDSRSRCRPTGTVGFFFRAAAGSTAPCRRPWGCRAAGKCRR